jgi:Fic family protein
MTHWIWQQKNWPNFIWDNSQLTTSLAEARLAQGKLLGLVQSFSDETQEQISAEMLTEEMITSSGIEGEVLDRMSVRSSIANRLGLKFASISCSPDRYIEGVLDMMLDATTRYDLSLDFHRLAGWQASLFQTGFSGIRQINIGKLRGEGEMQIVSGRPDRPTIHYVAPPQKKLAQEIENYIQWFNKNEQCLDGLIRAAIAHLWFEILHPFDDGNGRVGRAIVEMALAQDEKLAMRFYSLSSEIMATRKAYYQILQKTTGGDLDITDWLLWFLNCYSNAIKRAMKEIHNVCLKAKFWQLHIDIELNLRQRKALNKMLGKGKNGYQGGMTTRKYMAINKVSRATAFRELSDLVQKKCLESGGAKGRSVAYQIVWVD